MNWIKNFIINQVIGYIVNKKEVKKMFTAIKAFLAGKKTYLVALGTIIGTLIAWANGASGDAETLRLIIDAILAVTIRAGVAKVQ